MLHPQNTRQSKWFVEGVGSQSPNVFEQGFNQSGWYLRVNQGTLVCRIVWGGKTADRETMWPSHPIGCSSPAEINKDLLTNWQTSWLNHKPHQCQTFPHNLPTAGALPAKGPRSEAKTVKRNRKWHLSMERNWKWGANPQPRQIPSPRKVARDQSISPREPKTIPPLPVLSWIPQ